MRRVFWHLRWAWPRNRRLREQAASIDLTPWPYDETPAHLCDRLAFLMALSPPMEDYLRKERALVARIEERQEEWERLWRLAFEVATRGGRG